MIHDVLAATRSRSAIRAMRFGGMMLLAMGVLTAAAAQMLTVQVKETALRDRPSYLSPPLAQLTYGERVDVVDERGEWKRVTAGERTGWVHGSALARRRVDWAAGETEAQAAASQDELALAGKGFNADVEAAYRDQAEQLDFSVMDEMEEQEVDVRTLTRFLREGGTTRLLESTP